MVAIRNVSEEAITVERGMPLALSVGLVEHLRGEEKFDSLDALITQMGADCDRARTILAAL